MFGTKHALIVLFASFASAPASANTVAALVKKAANDEMKEEVNYLRGNAVSTISKTLPSDLADAKVTEIVLDATEQALSEDVSPIEATKLSLMDMSMFLIGNEEKNMSDEVANLREKVAEALEVAKFGAGDSDNGVYVADTTNASNVVNTLGEEYLSRNKKKSHSGISFERTIKHVDPSVKGLSMSFDGNFCKDSDKFGDNKCQFDWGKLVSGNVEGELAEDLDEGDHVEVDLKINNFIKFQFSCAVCGEDCTVKVPIVDEIITIEATPCPISRNLSNAMTIELPESGSGMHMNIKGSIKLVTQKDGDLIKVDTTINVD